MSNGRAVHLRTGSAEVRVLEIYLTMHVAAVRSDSLADNAVLWLKLTNAVESQLY